MIQKIISIFISYAHEDELLQKELEKHLSTLKKKGVIAVWHDREISAGKEWKREIDKYLQEADIILILVSPAFITSEYCYGIELKQALERHQRGEARVIPIILRPTPYWEETPLGELQGLCCKNYEEKKVSMSGTLFIFLRRPLRTAWRPTRSALSPLLLPRLAVALS